MTVILAAGLLVVGVATGCLMQVLFTGQGGWLLAAILTGSVGSGMIVSELLDEADRLLPPPTT